MRESIKTSAISVVIPIYNERSVLPGFLIELEENLKKSFKKYQIVLVDDGSTDGTFRYISNFKNNNKYRVLGFKKNQGQSAAIHYGVSEAALPVIATLDADGQNDPQDIYFLINFLKTGRAVCGIRTKRKDYFLRKIFSFVARKFLNFTGGFKALDPGCTLKVFYKKDFLELPFFNGMHRFLPYLFHNNGIDVVQKEIHHRSRLGGKSKYKLWARTFRVVFDIFGLMWLRRRTVRYRRYLKE